MIISKAFRRARTRNSIYYTVPVNPVLTNASNTGMSPFSDPLSVATAFFKGGTLTEDDWAKFHALNAAPTYAQLLTFISANRPEITVTKVWVTVGSGSNVGRMVFEGNRRYLDMQPTLLGSGWAGVIFDFALFLLYPTTTMSTTTAHSMLIEVLPQDIKNMGQPISISGNQGTLTENSYVFSQIELDLY